jgi:hypothetical protein
MADLTTWRDAFERSRKKIPRSEECSTVTGVVSQHLLVVSEGSSCYVSIVETASTLCFFLIRLQELG